MDTRLEIYTLGGIRILRNGELVAGLSNRKAEALLIYLARTRRAQPREVLAEMLWDERSQSQAMSNLRVVLTSLRQALGDSLIISRGNVELNPAQPIWLDASELEECLEAVHKQGAFNASRAAQAAEALELYQGDFLAGFSIYDCRGFEDWQRRERERLHQLVVDGLSELVEYAIEKREYSAGIAHATRLLEVDPLMESAHRQMMRLLDFSGQRAAAISQYETCQKLLKEDLEVEPDAETRQLYEQIRYGKLITRAKPDLLPSGTVTFLFTDIEGSTRLLEQLREGYGSLLAEQGELQRAAFEHWHGHEIDTQGDSTFVAFGRATDAIACVIEVQQALAQHVWPQGVSVKVRMGLYTGEPWSGDESYTGMTTHRAARIAQAAHGGQVLLSETTTVLIQNELPAGTSLVDLGRHLLKDIHRPEHLHQLVIEGLPARFPTLGSLQMLPPEGARPPRQVGECPYKGLAAFQEADAPFYFGREAFVDALEQAVRTKKLVAVIVGSSGSGKSSALLAGLLPRLRKEAGSQFAILRPSNQPFYALAGALMPLLESGLRETDRLVETRKLAEALTRGEVSVPQVVRRILEKTPLARRVVLVIDQFEELYTLCLDAQTHKALIDELLVTAAMAQGSREKPVVILLTLRADFMGQALAYRPFADALQEASLLLGPMTRQELHQAIEKPAGMQGAAFEAGLVERILDDVGEKPGNLPLLEFTLTQLWERQTDGWLAHADYEAMGSVEGALASYAGQVFSELTPEEQECARRALELLVQPGEGTEDTRRIATHDELGDENWVLIRRLADKRLVVTGRDAQGRETAEVVHEALIQKWGRFQEWLSEDRENLRLHRNLAAAAGEWLNAEKDTSLLYRGARLAQAQEWAEVHAKALSPQEREFLHASVEESQREAAEREAQRKSELETARQLAETQAQAARRLRRRAVYLGLALVAAFAMVFVAIAFARQAGLEANYRATAEAQALDAKTLSQAREWAMVAINNLTVDPQRSILLAMQAVKTADLPETENALHQAVRASRIKDSVIGHSANPYGLAIHPNGRQFATASVDGTIKIWSLDQADLKIAPHSQMTIMNPIEDKIVSFTSGHTLEYSPDGRLLAALAVSNTVKVWDASSGQLLHHLQGFTATVTCLAFSPDSKLLAAGSYDKTVRIWDPMTGEELQTLTHNITIEEVAWSSDGKRLATGSADYPQVTIWNRSEGSEMRFSFAYSFSSVLGQWVDRITFSRDDQQLAVTYYNIIATFDISHASAGSPPLLLHTFRGHKNGSSGLTYTPDGMSLVSSNADGNIKIWDTATGQERYTLPANSGIIAAIALSPDGKALLSTSRDHSIKLWDLSQTGNQEWFVLSSSYSGGGREISPDSKYLAYAPYQPLDNFSPHPWIDIYELTSSGAKEVRKIHIGYDLFQARYSPDFSQVIIQGPDTRGIRIFDMTTGQELMWIDTSATGVPDYSNDYYPYISFSPDGNRFAIAYMNGMVQIWDARTGQLLFTLTSPYPNIPYFMQFSPDGARFMTTASEDYIVRIWDLASSTVIKELKTNRFSRGYFNPDGKSILVAEDTKAILYDLMTFQPIYTISGHSVNICDLEFSRDGRYLATTDVAQVIKIWDTQTRKEVLTFNGGYLSYFTGDSKHLLIKEVDRPIVSGYFLDINDLMQLARSRLVRTWTLDECQKFLDMETCPPAP